MTSQQPGRTFGPQIRRLAVTVIGLTLLLATGPLLPAARFFPSATDYLPIHTGLEFVAMAVSLMVFGLGWNLRGEENNSHIVLLAATFLGVALIDFAHTLSYPGMPDVLGASAPEKAIDFWLAGRALAAIGLVAVAVLPVRSWPPRTCFAAVAAAIAVSSAVWWLGFLHRDWLPSTFVAGRGLTPFKIASEYVLAAGYFAAAVLLSRRAGGRRDANQCFLAAGAWVLGLSELFFTLYGDLTDLLNLIGHLYKAAAYVMLYRALFVAGVVAPQRALKAKEAELEHLAHYDTLTSLPNRLLAERRLAAMLGATAARGTQGALLLLDLDQFKNVNDSLGHAAGDDLLRQVAARLSTRLTRGELLARMGGDEFVVLAPDLEGVDEARALAQGLIDALGSVFVLSGGQEIFTATSIGICRFPRDGVSVDQVIRNADAALYEAKAEGAGGLRFYSRALTEAVDHRVDMERRLRRGLERDEFTLHYQPLVRCADGRITGVEALIRWQPPGGAMVPAAQFIKVAEDTGLIIPLGEWVLRQACRQMQAWREEGLALDTMAVNLSPRQFRRPDIAPTVAAVLAQSGLPAHHLELEITEGSLMAPGPEVEATLAALKTLGTQLAIDDFGTGYSSLAYLKRFPVDKLKVDQSFVRDIPGDPKGMEITAAIVGLGRALGIEVLAEGVETETQLAHLRRLGCDTVQGYLLAKPMPADALAALMRGNAESLRLLHYFGAAAAAMAEPEAQRDLFVA
jgi:diguanylate cyclase (GGDEF)-like protein